MRCLYCGTPLAILRILSNGTFCCDEHHDLYEKQAVSPPLESPLRLRRPAARRCDPASQPNHPPLDSIEAPGNSLVALNPSPAAKLDLAGPRRLPAPKPRTISRRLYLAASQPIAAPSRRLLPNLKVLQDYWQWPPAGGPVPLPLAVSRRRAASNRAAVKAVVTPNPDAGQPLMPRLDATPQFSGTNQADPPPLSIEAFRQPAASSAIDLSTQKLREIWRQAPGDLKLIAMVIPMVLLLTLNAAGPKLYTKPVAIKASSQPMLDGILTREWHAIRKSIAQRAGFNYADNFRSGLDAWTSSGAGLNWSYDNMGFVRPAALALFRPTLQLADYDVEFIGRFEQRALGFVFRAPDSSNYQAVKLVAARTGPLPEVHLIRYTVLNGKEGPRTDRILPIPLSRDTFFTVHLDVRGNDFTLMIQEKLADFWSDDRLKTGGIGFFCGKGESACLRRVSVAHQNDTLGRVCAFIASDGMDDNNGS